MSYVATLMTTVWRGGRGGSSSAPRAMRRCAALMARRAEPVSSIIRAATGAAVETQLATQLATEANMSNFRRRCYLFARCPPSEVPGFPGALHLPGRASRRFSSDASVSGRVNAPSSTVSERDVDRALRRVNRRIESGVASLSKHSKCVEEAWTWGPMEGRRIDLRLVDGANVKSRGDGTRGTLIFLHGFGDTGEHWAELAELLVRGMPGGYDVILPDAPLRRFLIGNREQLVPAWFEPRLKNSRDPDPLLGAGDDAGGKTTPWKCGGIEAAVAWARALLAEVEARGAAPGSVVIAGFSQGAGLALAVAAEEERAGRSPTLGGVLCLRGYLPITRDALSPGEGAKKKSDEDAVEPGVRTGGAPPPAVLLCQGGRDPVAPVDWARAAADTLRGRRRASASEPGRVELLVCEDRGHELGPDDVWRTRWWLRSLLLRDEKADASEGGGAS